MSTNPLSLEMQRVESDERGMIREWQWSIVWLIFGLLGLIPSAVDAQEDWPSDIGDQVRGVLIEHCAECHGAGLARPKARFGYIEDLERVSAKYVKAGKPDDSDLWFWLVDPENPMPPKKAEVGALTASEIALVRWWIEVGAPKPVNELSLGDAPKAPRAAVSSDDDEASGGALSQWSARLHPLLIHFPIALILLAMGLEFLVVLGRDEYRAAVRLILWVSILLTFAAAWTGWSAADIEGYSEATIGVHRNFGVASLGTSCGAALLLSFGGRRSRPLLIGRILLVAAGVLVTLAGHQGGLLVHGWDHFGG